MRTSSILSCGTWLIHKWDMTHPYAGHDSFICVTWRFIHETWLIHMCDLACSYVRHDSFTMQSTSSWSCWTWLIYMWDMTHSCARHDLILCQLWDTTHSCVTWLICMWDMTHSYARHDSILYVLWDTTHSCVTWLLLTHMWNESTWVMSHKNKFCRRTDIEMSRILRMSESCPVTEIIFRDRTHVDSYVKSVNMCRHIRIRCVAEHT